VTFVREVLESVTDDFEIVIVDDCSTDRTNEIGRELSREDPRVRLIRNERNLKLGGTLRAGFAAASKDLVFYTDADLPFDLALLAKATRLLQYLEVDMITAFRFDRTGEGIRRAVYSLAYNWLIRLLFRVRVRDINFSFKLMKREVLGAITLKSEGSFIDAELLAKALRKGFKLAQFGVDYFPRTRGISTLSSFGVIWKILREMISLYGDVRRTKPERRPAEAPAPGTAGASARGSSR
jgi:glycosyltransferase involved in cell wall biosynthesis